jgi:hypothetical protein
VQSLLFEASMKKWIPWLIGALVVLILLLRLAYSHVGKLNDEKVWYISQLHYDCSARVDSTLFHSRALLTLTSGSLDADREWKLKEKLHAHGMLHLIIQRGTQYDLRVPGEAQVNDSICIHSDRDLLALYRNGALVLTRPLSESLRQRPF